MLFTTIFLVFAAAGSAFSAPVPPTALARRQGLADAAVVPRDDTFSNGGSHHRSKRLVSRGQHAESVKRDAPERRQEVGTVKDYGTISPDGTITDGGIFVSEAEAASHGGGGGISRVAGSQGGGFGR